MKEAWGPRARRQADPNADDLQRAPELTPRGPNTASLTAPAHRGVTLRTQGSSFATALAFCKTSRPRLLWTSAASD